MSKEKNAIVLLSGGLDSATCLAIAKAAGYTLHALSFDYGQKNTYEGACAERLAKAAGCAQHLTIKLPHVAFNNSALTDPTKPVPKHASVEELPAGVASTYVPARNTIFLSYALGVAESMGGGDIFIGVNALDFSGYPDCRPVFIHAYQVMANMATVAKVDIRSPLISLTKKEIILRGLSLGVDYAITSSCYQPQPGGGACGHCPACLLRLRGFEEAGVVDPVQYAKE